MYSPDFNITNPYGLWKEQKSELYQPPLSAYAPEYPGPTNFGANNPYSASTHEKLNRLNQIKYYGYKTLKPIGVNKTMEQLDIENTIADTTMPTTLENDLIDPSLQVDVDPDADLDQDMPNLDSDEDLNLNDEDDGFMAEDVEYQHDHSLGTSTVGNSGGAGRRNASGMEDSINMRDASHSVLDSSFSGDRAGIVEDEPAEPADLGSGVLSGMVGGMGTSAGTASTVNTGTTIPSVSTNATDILDFGKTGPGDEDRVSKNGEDGDDEEEEDMVLDDDSS